MIATNKRNIQSNTDAIDANKGNIQSNTDTIGRHETAIQNNKNDIATNKGNIQSNTNAINENRTNIEKGWNIKVVDGSTYTEGNIQLGEELTVEGTGNIKTEFNQPDKKLTVKMVDNPSFTSAKIGGIDLADGKISNVSSSAATGSVATYEQLKPIFKALNLTPDGTSGVVNDGDLTGKYLGKDNVEEAFKVPMTFEDTHNNKAQVSLGEKVAFGANGPVDIKLDSRNKKYTISISENPTFTGKVTATGGFDANNEKIINMADGSSPTDAVTLRQLNAVEDKINNTTATAIALSTNAPVVYTALNSKGNQEVVVKIESIDEHGIKHDNYYYKSNLAKDPADGILKPVYLTENIKDLSKIQVSAMDTNGEVKKQIKLGNLANGNIKSGSTDAITGDQLAPVIKALGMKIIDENRVDLTEYETGNDKTYNNVRDVFLGRAKGEYGTSIFTNGADKIVYTKKVDGSDPGYYRVSDLESEGLKAKANATPVNENEVKISLQKHDGGNVVLGNLADGKEPNDAVNVSQLNKFGLDVNSTKPVVTYTDGNKKKIELKGGADGTKITNVAKGIDEKDAVNVGQVNEIKNSLSNDIQTIRNDTWKLAAGGTLEPINVKQGEMVAFVGDNNIDVSKTDGTAKHTVAIKLKDVVKVGNVKPVTIDGKEGIITGLTNIEWDGTDKTTSNKAATEAQLGKIEGAIKTDISNINNTLGDMKNVVKYDDDTKNNIELKGINGTLITNVAKGKIIPGSRDAVTGAQFDTLQKILTGQNGKGTDLEFKVSLNNNNNFEPAYYTNVKDALEALKHGWRVAGGEIDHIAGATHIEQGETLVVSGDKNISTKISSTTVGRQEYKLTNSQGNPIYDEDGQQKVEVFEGKIGTLSIALSDTPEFTNITVTNPGGDDNSVVTRKVLKDVEKLAVKYDNDAKDSITLNSSGTTIKNVKYGKNDADAVNVKQIKDLVGGNVAYDGTKWTGMGFEILKGKGMPTEAPTGILDAIKANISAINRGLVFEGDNENNSPQYLGSKLSVKTDNIGTAFEGKNLKTYYKLDSDTGNGTIKIGLSKNPEFDSMTLGKIKMTPGADKLTLSSDNGLVVFDGLKAGKTPDSAVTKGEFNALEHRIGSLDVSVGGQVQELQDGTAGTMVYTNSEGDRLVKVRNNYYKKADVDDRTQGLTEINGKYYNATAIEDGHVIPGQEESGKTLDVLMAEADRQTDIIISAVKPHSTDDTKTPMSVGNIASGLGLTDTYSMSDTSSIKDDQVKGLLSKTKDTELNRVSTVRDLQAVAKAGLNFKGNDKKEIQRPVGSLLGIEGRKDTEYITTGATTNSVTYSDINMITHSDGEVLRIEMLKSPKFEGIVVNNGKDGANGKNSIITVDDNGNLIIKNGVSGQDGKPGADGLAGKDGKAGQKVATIKDVDNLSKKLGLNGNDGSAGISGTDGPAGKDGLDGKSILDKVQGLRDGMVGTMVYTDKDGNRLVREGNEYYKQSDFNNYTKANDGNYYDKVDENGKPEDGATKLEIGNLPKVAKDTIRISAVDPAYGDSEDNRVVLNNIKSALDIKGDSLPIKNEEASKAVDSLLTQKTDLDKAATGRDLQALAQAGINIKGNDTDKISHIPLSGKFNIIGSDTDYRQKDNSKLYSAENLITHTDGSDTIRIEMLKSPSFKDLVLNGSNGADGKSAIVTVDSNGNLVVKSGTDGKDGVNGLDGTGRDGSNGFSKIITEKDLLEEKRIQELKDGLGELMVYTDKDGNELVKDKAGEFYGKDENGNKKENATDKENIHISAVHADGTTGTPIVLRNIGSALTTSSKSDEVEKAKDIVGTQLLVETAPVNAAATVKDLKTLALAGLEFAGNDGDTIHKNLGEKLNIEGKEKAVYNKNIHSSDNLVTYNDEGTLRVAMLKNPKFDTVTLTDGKNDVTLAVTEKDGKDGTNGVGIKGTDGKVDKFITEKTVESKLKDKGFKVKVKDKELKVNLGDTLEFTNTDANIVLTGLTKDSTSSEGTTEGTTDGTTGGTVEVKSSETSKTPVKQVNIDLAENMNLKADNIKAKNKVEAKEVIADKVTTKEIVTEKITTDKFVTDEVQVGSVVIKNGEISGVKTAELDESGHVAKEDEDKLVNGGTLNKTIDNLRAENAQFREGVQGAIQQNSQRISKLETKVNKGLANAAAMAGINFMEIGVNQATVGAAVGGYEGTQAVAVGVQAAPTQDLRVNAKVSLTPGSHSSSMYSVGASWRFDLR